MQHIACFLDPSLRHLKAGSCTISGCTLQETRLMGPWSAQHPLAARSRCAATTETTSPRLHLHVTHWQVPTCTSGCSRRSSSCCQKLMCCKRPFPSSAVFTTAVSPAGASVAASGLPDSELLRGTAAVIGAGCSVAATLLAAGAETAATSELLSSVCRAANRWRSALKPPQRASTTPRQAVRKARRGIL